MKIICPNHYGPIEVPDIHISDAFKNPLSTVLLICPVCGETVRIHNIQLEYAAVHGDTRQ